MAYAGLVGYNSLEKALAAAKNGDTVGIIVKNLNLKEELNIPAGVTLTLNLHGNNLNLNGAAYPVEDLPANVTVIK